MIQTQRAILFGPEQDKERWEKNCLAYCERHGYEVVGLVVGGEEKWPAVRDALMSGLADVAVVSSMAHLPPDRSPRVESVTEELHMGGEHRARRTRIIRLDEEA